MVALIRGHQALLRTAALCLARRSNVVVVQHVPDTKSLLHPRGFRDSIIVLTVLSR